MHQSILALPAQIDSALWRSPAFQNIPFPPTHVLSIYQSKFTQHSLLLLCLTWLFWYILLDMILNIAHNFTSIATKGYNAIYQHRTTYPLILKKNIKCLMQYCPDSQCWGLNLVPVDDTTPLKNITRDFPFPCFFFSWSASESWRKENSNIQTASTSTVDVTQFR